MGRWPLLLSGQRAVSRRRMLCRGIGKTSSDNFDLITHMRCWRPTSRCRGAGKIFERPQHLCLFRDGCRRDAWDDSLAHSDQCAERNRRNIVLSDAVTESNLMD